MVLVHPGALAQVQSLQNFWRRQVQVAGSDIARKNLLLFCALRLASASLDCSCCRCKVCKNLDYAAGAYTLLSCTASEGCIELEKNFLLILATTGKACRMLRLVYRRLRCLQSANAQTTRLHPNAKTAVPSRQA